MRRPRSGAEMKVFRLAIVKTWRELRDPYRPELHYMRGPGPRTLDRQRAHTTGEMRAAREPASSKLIGEDNLLAT